MESEENYWAAMGRLFQEKQEKQAKYELIITRAKEGTATLEEWTLSRKAGVETYKNICHLE